MSKNVALLFVLVFLTAPFMLVVKPVFSSTDILGFIIIKEDGSVEGINEIQRDGNVYSFTGNIDISGEHAHSGIQILKDNIVIDGV